MSIFGKKKYYRVRSMIFNKSRNFWSTHQNDNYLTKNEAQKRYNEIYDEWKQEIIDGTFTLELDEFDK